MTGGVRNAKRQKKRKSVDKTEVKAKIAETLRTSRNLKPGAIQHLRTIQNTIRKGS